MERKCINDLKADHQWILQALEVLREMAGQLETSGNVDRQDVLELLEFFRTFAHEYHDAKEQFLLVPAVTEAGLSLNEVSLNGIASDHCHIYTAIETLRTALVAKNDTEFVDLATAYRELLTTHIFNEDHFLFDAIDSGLTPERDERIMKTFDEFEPQLRESSRVKFDAVVRALGQKYSVHC